MAKLLEKSPYLVVFILGFFLGRFTLSKPQKIVTENKTEAISDLKSQVSVQATTKKDSTMGKETIIVHKSYSPNGKLKSETTTQVKSEEVIQVDSRLDASQEVHIHTFENTDTKKEISYQYDWLVGLSAPVSNITHPSNYRASDFKVTLAYRVLDSSYVFVESNYQLKTAEVGFLFPL